MKFFTCLLLLLAAEAVPACELCAIYNAANALGQSGSGPFLGIAEQYIAYNVSQFNDEVVTPLNPSYVYSSITHFLPGYNFSSRFGVSLNVPLEYLNFKRTDLRYSLTAPPVLFTEKGTELGLGDIALIGRVAIIQQASMHHSLAVNALAGVKFPTGDASRLDDEVAQAQLFQSLLPPGTPHDPLAHSVSSVHQHMLALGSGSYDGVFGLTANARWQRWFFNAQFQYYLRTEGEAGFEYGDEILVSGGPGVFLVTTASWSLSLQANGLYDQMQEDELLGKTSSRTGSTAWYVGPLLAFTWGGNLSVTAGVDVPLQISNGGYQSVPSYRVNGGVSWRF
jgi:hypothetical protein